MRRLMREKAELPRIGPLGLDSGMPEEVSTGHRHLKPLPGKSRGNKSGAAWKAVIRPDGSPSKALKGYLRSWRNLSLGLRVPCCQQPNLTRERVMLNISEDDLKAAIVEKAADEILRQDDDLTEMIRKEVKSRIDKIFIDRANAQIETMIGDAIKDSFNHEYQRVTQWGEPSGPKTTIRNELEKTVSGYWTAKVDAKTGKPSTSDWSSVTRAEYVMTQICAEDFSKMMLQSVANVTGALKDGLRNQLAQQMDSMLNDLFCIKSLQDQGKVEKPY